MQKLFFTFIIKHLVTINNFIKKLIFNFIFKIKSLTFIKSTIIYYSMINENVS